MTDVVDFETAKAKQRAKKSKPKAQPREGWEAQLQVNDYGQVRKSLANVMTILSRHPEWCDVLAYDAFAEAIVATKAPPTRDQDRPSKREIGEWSDVDSVRTAAWLSDNYRIDVAPTTVDQAIQSVADRHIVHPVRDYLNSLKWDADQRLPSMLATHFGAEHTPYTAAIGTRWMIGAVARVMRPGCKVDTMVVLEGAQGIMKSSALRALAGPQWFADSGLSIGDKDGYQLLRRVWIYEIPEFASIKAARDIERVKAFLTSQVDHYRPSYARRSKDFPRQCVFAGSTNESEYLLDRTGSRRFWPFACGRIDIAAIERDRDQLWAEAVTRFQSKERWWVDSVELRRLCEAEQEDRTPQDPWIHFAREWFTREGMDDPDRIDPAKGITTAEFLRGAISMNKDRVDRAAETRAGHVLRELGWRHKRVRTGNELLWKYFPPVPTCTNATEEGQNAQ